MEVLQPHQHEIDLESFRWCKTHMRNSEEYNGVVPAEHIIEVKTDVENKEFSGEEAKYSFDIVTKDRTFHVAAENKSEQNSWVEAVQAVVENNISKATSTEHHSEFDHTNPVGSKDNHLAANDTLQKEASHYADILGDSLEGFPPSARTSPPRSIA